MLIKPEKIPVVLSYPTISDIRLFFHKNIELIIVSLSFVCLWVFLTIVAGGPTGSDELWYMQVGLNNIKAPISLNRYFHIYLQKIFMELAPNPLLGSKIFWSFLVSLTGFLVYLNARYFTDKNNILHGATAVILFFSIDLLSFFSGVTVVDITAMTMVMVVVTFYVFSLRCHHTQPYLLIMMGVMFFLGFKTKETTLVLGLLLIGLGFSQDGSFQPASLKKNLRSFLTGMFLGIALFILMNTVILKDPFFGMLPSSYQSFYDFYSRVTSFVPVPQDWFKDYLFQSMLVPFLFYLLSGSRAIETLPVEYRLLWLVPVGFIALMTASMISSNWGATPRYILPVIGIICMLAAQMFVFVLPNGWRKWLLFTSVLGLELIVLYMTRLYIHHLMYDLNMNSAYYFESLILMPISLIGLLAAVYILRQGTHFQTIFSVIFLIVLLIYPVLLNVKSIVLKQPNVERAEERFYPFSSFASLIYYEDDMKFFVSTNIHAEHDMLSENKDELLSMFNVYFDKDSKRYNFVYDDRTEKLTREILSKDFDYILLTKRDWNDLSQTSNQQLVFVSGYQLHTEESDRIVLLTRNFIE
ncbi:MAG: hypothetical protein EHM41_02670 [Chloroflexi bacterium]|nr:MAG: hypothetical protein EHM41_02670 [Chloroflexota bacterium]